MKNHNAKYAFYYLLSLAALIFTALSVQMIIFGIIDKTMVDAINFNSYSSVDAQLKFAVSALFIAAPVYFFIMRLINRGLREKELDLESPLRRWLTYFIILIASVIILGVFVGVINSFLSGELTTRFILKAVSMLVMAAIVFFYYFYDTKRQSVQKKDKVVRWSGWASAGLVLAVFVSAWFFVEAPSVARAKRLDQVLLNNIYQLENSVNTYYSQYNRLPATLEEIKNSDVYFDEQNMTDPETGEVIVYRIQGEKIFSFCATFRTASEENNNSRPSVSGDKDHAAGYDCVKGTIWATAKPVEQTELID